MTLGRAAQMQSWPTPNAQVSQDGELPETWLKRKEAMKAKGYNGNGCGTPLTIAVQLHGQAALANWPTPCANDDNKTPEAHLAMKRRMGERDGTNSNRTAITSLQVMCKALHGQAAPASSSSLGSRQGLSWPTPQTMDTLPVRPVQEFAETNKTRGGRKNRKALSNLREAVHSPVYQASWATPQAKDHKSGHRDPTIVQYKQLNVEVEARATGKLNPRWVETLMGLPIGWTMPSCTSPQTIAPTSCDSSAMELSRLPQSEPSEFFLAS
jgi:hypothetical protein